MREELYPHLSDAPLAENRAAHAELADKIERLAVPLPIPGAPDARAALEVNGAWYALEDNPMGITRMRLSFKEDEGTWEYSNGQGDNVLRFGIGRVLSGKFPQRNYFGEQIGSVPGIEYDCLGLGRVDRRADAQHGSLYHGYLLWEDSGYLSPSRGKRSASL